MDSVTATQIKFHVEDGEVTVWRETYKRDDFGTKPYMGETTAEGIEDYRKSLEEYFQESVVQA